jgi:thiol-disulfide isomerase/thioredoxin
MREIYCELTPNSLVDLQRKMENEITIIKFGADWCNPCNKIKPLCELNFDKLPKNVIIFDIDVDESLDLYATLKKNKMVKGVPSLLCYYADVPRQKWYIPDDSISGSNKEDIQAFFNRCAAKASSL